MTPQELKNSILQLAIQGKLVEQRPEEGTAEELFAKIQEERQQLIVEKKIKKEKPLPEITENEKPFDIPESWILVRIKDFCLDIFSGKSPVYSKEITDYKVIGQAANQQSGLDFSQLKYTVQEFWDAMEERYFLRENDVLLNTLGNGTLGRSGIIKKIEYPLLTDGHLFVFRCSSDVLSRYCYYFLQFKKSDIEKSANGSTNQTFLSLRNTVTWVIPMPPIAEQKRIVAKIEELLPYIDRYEQAWSELEQFNSRFPEDMKKSLLQYAIQGKLVEQRPEEGTAEELFSRIQEERQRLIAEKKIKKEKTLPEITEDEKPFDIPESWKWVRFGDISIFQGGYAYKSTSYIPKSNNQVIRLGNIKQGDFLPSEKQVFISDDLANETDQYRIKANDILISMTGTRRKKDYFYAVIIEENMLQDTAYYLNQRVGCFRTFNNIYPQFLYYVLRCETIREIIFTKETGTANQGNLGSEDIKKYVYIPLPPLAEQKRIVKKLEQLLPLCERLK